MTPQDQTLLVERDGRGDCWRASVASILDLPIAEVPECGVTGTALDQERETREWLRSRGLTIRYVSDWSLRAESDAARYVLACGLSPRDVAHAVVGDLAHPVFVVIDERASAYYAREVTRQFVHIAHDPHPSRAGIRWPDQLLEIVPLAEVKP